MSGSNTPRSTGPPRIGRIGQWGSTSSSNSRPGSSSTGGAGRIATFRDITSGAPQHPSHNNHGDEKEEDEKKKEGETWFAGGERRYAINNQWMRIGLDGADIRSQWDLSSKSKCQ